MLRNLVNYIKDKDYLIAVYNDKIYIYNYKRIIDVDNNVIRIELNNKKLKINGKNIVVKKLENNEILLNLECKGIEFYE